MTLPYAGENQQTANLTVPEAVIFVTPIDTNPDNDSKFIDGIEDDPLSIYADYMIVNRYEKDKSIYMSGVTSPDGFQNNKVSFFKLATDTLLWICEWTACRWDKQPEAPNTTPSDSGWVLLDEHYDLPKITVGAGGNSALYRISGVYVYGCLNPSANTPTQIRFPRPPWLADEFSRTIPLGNFVSNLKDGSGGAGTPNLGIPISPGNPGTAAGGGTIA